MGYAIRNDGQGWRACDNVEEILTYETYSETEPTLSPSFQSELAILNATYQADVEKFNRAFSTAYLADGSEQESKQLTIRSQYVARKAAYTAAVLALREQFETGV